MALGLNNLQKLICHETNYPPKEYTSVLLDQNFNSKTGSQLVSKASQMQYDILWERVTS